MRGSWWPRPQRKERGGALTRYRGMAVGKVITLFRGGGTEHLLSLRELRLSTGLAPRPFAAALAAEAGEPMPTSVYLAYEGDEEPPASIVRAARRVAHRLRRSPRPEQIVAGGTVEVSPAPR